MCGSYHVFFCACHPNKFSFGELGQDVNILYISIRCNSWSWAQASLVGQLKVGCLVFNRNIIWDCFSSKQHHCYFFGAAEVLAVVAAHCCCPPIDHFFKTIAAFSKVFLVHVHIYIFVHVQKIQYVYLCKVQIQHYYTYSKHTKTHKIRCLAILFFDIVATDFWWFIHEEKA